MKMVTTTEILILLVAFVLFGWVRWRQSHRSRSRRRALARMRRLNPFDDQQEEDSHEILATFVSNAF